MRRAHVMVSIVLLAVLAGCSLPFGDRQKTVVTLSVGGEADHGQIETVLRQRVTGGGMPKPSFTWEANGLVMTVPGDHHGEDFAQLTAPGVLEFRRVLTRSSSTSDCTAAPVPPDQPLTACDGERVAYGLDVAKVVRSDVDTATYQQDQSAQHAVLIKFTSSGQAKFTALTREAVSNSGTPSCAADALGSSGNCLVAIVLDGKVISAPEILQVLTGDVVIQGSFTAAQAKQLAALIGSPQLPVTLALQSVSLS
jgi:preprotein translocase subunit SecD